MAPIDLEVSCPDGWATLKEQINPTIERSITSFTVFITNPLIIGYVKV
ncbi:MAG TPA: hypothetical protein VLY86_02295 [Methanothrix sp.]|nr:hypothetical protein [Methanothrix sp.]